jgi:Spy/CpxP family protein refolding chaperone
MTRKTLLPLACLALLSAPLAFAQGSGSPMMSHHEMGGESHGGMSMMGPGGMWWKNPHIIELLTLTPDQEKKMNAIFDESRIRLIDMHANVEKAEVPMPDLLAANPPDTAKVLAQIDKLAQARAELEKADARMLLGIRGVLTPDQWTKLQAEEHSHHGMSMRGGSGGHGEPQGGPQQGPQGMRQHRPGGQPGGGAPGEGPTPPPTA